MCKPSLKRLITGVVIFALSAYLVTYFTTKILYFIFALILIFLLAKYLTQEYPNSVFGKEKQLYQKLLQRSRGDQKLVERLIEYERRRSPDSNRADLLQSAIYHWNRDNR